LLRSVSMCYPSENQRQLIENIVLCGGTSMMTGMSK
jgi:actin-related protein 7